MGHIVSWAGIETNPKKVEKVLSWPRPQTVTTLQEFLGLCNYYRKFIENFSSIARPLYKLLTGIDNKNTKSRSGRNAINWTDKHEECFKNIKECLHYYPVLTYTNYTKPFKVHTDASEIGLGAVLYQDQDEGPSRVIAYASRSLMKSERRYHSPKLEFLALKWAITDQFHEYLYGGTFEVHTDNNPLTYVLTTAKLDAMGQRWVASLANYNFKVIYHSGKQNTDADTLSRILWDTEQVNATLERGLVRDCHMPYSANIMSIQPEVLPKMTNKDWIREQENDTDIKHVRDLMKSNKHLQYKCLG